MIDWGNLIAYSLWICGCILALAALSFASWQASIHAEKLLTRLSKPIYSSILVLAGMLFCTGQFFIAETVLFRALWVVLGILLLAACWNFLKKRGSRE